MANRTLPAPRALDRLLDRMSSFGRMERVAGKGRHASLLRLRRATRRGPKQLHVEAPATDMTHWQEVKRFYQDCRFTLRARPECLRIDLAAVEQADIKLVSCLVRIYQLATRDGVRMETILPETVEQILAVCRLEQLIEQTRPGGAGR